MAELRRFGLPDLLLFILILVVAGGVRAGYLAACADYGRNGGPLAVADPEPPELDALVHNLKENNQFSGPAPLADAEELTAHRAPGYPWLLSGLARVVDQAALHSTVRWVQCGLGALTAGLYFLFARRAFRSLVVATLTGLACALHPFWVIDTAAVGDGVLTTFLLGLAVVLGCRAGQTGGPFASLVYGLTLAGLALVRAALLPLAFVALGWLLLRSRRLARGWLAALLAFLGFANGLAPWTVRNLQTFHEPLPVVDSAYLHLWAGNNQHADGGPLTQEMLDSAPPDLNLRQVKEQPQRYALLAGPVWKEARAWPAEALRRRLQAGLAFVFGTRWFKDGHLAAETSSGGAMPGWLAGWYEPALQGALLAMLLLAALGWRWSYGWRWESMPASLAMVWVPLPYILSHAEALSGPRLPLDGVLWCYATFALACLVPGVAKDLLDGPREEKAERQA
jgi:hypothetical protein